MLSARGGRTLLMDDFLKRGVHVARVGEDLVFLDRGGDAYSVLRGAGSRARFFSGSRRCELDEACRGALREAALLSRDDGPGDPLVTGLLAPAYDLDDRELGTRPLLQAAVVIRAARLAADVAIYGASGLNRLVRASGGPARLDLLASAPPDRRTIREAMLFDDLMDVSPWRGACLMRSFGLRRALRRVNRSALWVFAVRTWPFQAHCWLQCGTVVLNDKADRLTSFTPIMVV